MDDLKAWFSHPEVATFPFASVLADIRAVGKHAAPVELLVDLDHARQQLSAGGIEGADLNSRRLAAFLDTVLDRRDDRFDAATYLALRLLPLPEASDEDLGEAWRRHDRLIVAIVADLLRFEQEAMDGSTGLLPRHRPGPALVDKRLRLGMRALTPAYTRLGLPVLGGSDPADADRVCASVAARMPATQRLAVDLSMLPVDVFHDEWMFIRVLQAYETVFALMAAQLHTAVSVLTMGNVRLAAIFTDGATSALRDASPLFSMMATLQPRSFTAFRTHTHGASAIQSVAAKTVEALCRTPDAQRLASPAFDQVPQLRQAILDGSLVGLEDIYQHHLTAGKVQPRHGRRLEEAMRGLGMVMDRWRTTHHRLAMRFLGNQPGTAASQGAAYLDQVRTVPVFRRLPSNLRA
jgi:tryptophan 2,3-dioxygenase